MPRDGKGNFHLSTQRAMAADRIGGGKKAPIAKASPEMPMGGEGAEHEEDGGNVHQIHIHGDGTFHSVSPEGEKTEHEDIGHAATHFMAKHGEEGHRHMAVHHDGMSLTTHHAESGGEVQGPHEHDPQNMDGLKDHMQQFFNEEAGERY